MKKHIPQLLFVTFLAHAISGCGAKPIPTEEPATGGSLPGDTRIRSADGMVMVYVPGGEFQMGSDDDDVDHALQMCTEYRDSCEREWFLDELPVHSVVLDSFWIDRTEVTNGQYQRCVDAGICTPPIMNRSYTRDPYYGNSTYDDYPVIHVTWNQAVDYCEWMNARLPTEAEWEYTARGPERRVFPWGDTFDGTRLNYCDVNCDIFSADGAFDDGYNDTAPVGSYPDGASWCGALDMAGNAREYIADWYDSDYYGRSPTLNPTGPSSWTRGRAVRGGSWGSGRAFTRSAFRFKDDPRNHVASTGFRCVSPASP